MYNVQNSRINLMYHFGVNQLWHAVKCVFDSKAFIYFIIPNHFIIYAMMFHYEVPAINLLHLVLDKQTCLVEQVLVELLST
jgi:hypothetical protein